MGKVKNKKKKRGSMRSGVARAAQAAKSGVDYLEIPSGVNLYKEEAGKTSMLDIVPYIVANPARHPEAKFIPEDIWWRFPYKVHKNIGPEKLSILCPTTIGKPCPICEERQAIFDDPDADDEVAKGLKASKRSLYLVVDKSKKASSSDPMLWDISDYCFHDMLNTELNCGEEDWGDFPNLEGGYTLKVRFAEESFGGNKFAMCDRIDFKERDDYEEAILDEVPSLDELLLFLKYEQIYNLFQGIDEDEIVTGDEEEEEVEPPKKTTGKKKPAPVEEEDEEVEPPKRKKKTTRKKKVEPVEEEDAVSNILADDEEEEEVEPPKRERKAANSKKKEKVKDEGCPFDHVFGDDFDDHEECDDCAQFDNCLKKAEED